MSRLAFVLLARQLAHSSGAMRRTAPQRSLPLCGGGTGRGVAADSEFGTTPLPTPPPQGAGLSHLGEYREKKHIVPSGLFDFSSDGSLVGMRSEHVEGDLSQKGDVLRSVVLAVAGAVLVEDDVEHPMELVLDGPVGAHDLEQLVGRERLGEQEVSGLGFVWPALAAAQGVDLRQRANAREVVGFGQGGVGDDLCGPLFASPMAGLDLRPEGVGLVERGEAALDRLEERALVLLEGQNIFAAGIEDGLGHCAMAVQGIHGDDTAFERQQLDCLQGTDNFVAPWRQPLCQGQALLRRPDIDQMQGRSFGALGEGSSDGLAIDRHNTFEAVALGKCGHKPGEGRLEGLGIEQAEHPAEGVVARSAMLQAQDLPKHLFLGLAEIGHVRAALRSAQNCRQRDEQKLQQIVPRVLRARVLQVLENRNKAPHRSLPNKERSSESKSSPAAILPKYPYAIPLPCGGGMGRGVAANSESVATPLPVPPPQGGRERCGTRSRNASYAIACCCEWRRCFLCSLRSQRRRPRSWRSTVWRLAGCCSCCRPASP